MPNGQSPSDLIAGSSADATTHVSPSPSSVVIERPKETCLTYNNLLDRGVQNANLVTGMVCLTAGAFGGSNLPANAACAAGGVVSRLGSFATSTIDCYCNTLPDTTWKFLDPK